MSRNIDGDIILSSDPLRVTKVVKQTKARLFEDFIRGTVFTLQIKLVNTRGGANGLYALEVLVYNDSTGKGASFTQNEVLRYLSCFEVEAL